MNSLSQAPASIPRRILPLIVIAQFCCTSLWFAGNAVLPELTGAFNLPESALPHLTSAVQFGFITGTLVFALLTLSDRFSPSRVFFSCALLGATFNFLIILEFNTFISLMLLRFATGYFLAGIYPVGMKIASDYFTKGLGKSLGFLVGALVLGTAFPHILNVWTGSLSWDYVIIFTSLLAISGGILIAVWVPDGPNRVPGQKLDLSAFSRVFKDSKFRSAAFGYFGHMWELYAFWAFTPIIIATYNSIHPDALLSVSLWSFVIIGIGSLGCIAGGYLAQKQGTARTAFTALLFSGLCCLVSPLVFQVDLPIIFLLFLVFWGITVIADSPLFSTLVAQNASPEIKGTALTIVNCIGFSITIMSIQLVNIMEASMSPTAIYLLLLPGPFFGLISIFRHLKKPAPRA